MEAKRMLFPLWASVPCICLDIGDVAHDYFHARARRRVYVELSSEDLVEGKCGLLKKAMHSTRDAAQNWELECTEMIAEASSKQGLSNACGFYHEQKSVRVAVNGDDFTVLGPSKSLDLVDLVFSFHPKRTQPATTA